MIGKRKLLINAGVGWLQFLVAGGIIFVLYRFLLDTIGAEELGLWSVLNSLTNVANLGNMGLSGGVTKFVAQYVSRDDHKGVASVVDTAFISLSVFIGVVIVILYPIASYALSYILPTENVADARLILPLMFVSTWILLLVNVLESGLDGYQRMDTRGYYHMMVDVVYLCICLVIVPVYGLRGFALCYLIRAILLLIGGRILLSQMCSHLPLLPYKWRRVYFHEMLRYGINLQMISVFQMLVDPVTKAFLARFGGLSITAYYELAIKLMFQIRGMLVSACRAITPVIADLHERASAHNISDFSYTMFRVLLISSFPLYGGVVVLLPVISKVWIGTIQTDFIMLAIIITVAYLVNTLSVPIYFANLGTGQLRDNVISQMLIGVGNILLGFTLGQMWDGYGVIIGWALATVIGGSYQIIAFAHDANIPSRSLLTGEDKFLASASTLSAISCVLVYHFSMLSQWSIFPQLFSLLGGYGLLLVFPLFRHSMRGRIQRNLINVWQETRAQRQLADS